MDVGNLKSTENNFGSQKSWVTPLHRYAYGIVDSIAPICLSLDGFFSSEDDLQMKTNHELIVYVICWKVKEDLD